MPMDMPVVLAAAGSAGTTPAQSRTKHLQGYKETPDEVM
jgi:hypothetical protein